MLLFLLLKQELIDLVEKADLLRLLLMLLGREDLLLLLGWEGLLLLPELREAWHLLLMVVADLLLELLEQ